MLVCPFPAILEFPLARRRQYPVAKIAGCSNCCELPAILRVTPDIARLRFFLWPAKRKPLQFLQRNGCEPARWRHGHRDFAMRALCRQAKDGAHWSEELKAQRSKEQLSGVKAKIKVCVPLSQLWGEARTSQKHGNIDTISTALPFCILAIDVLPCHMRRKIKADVLLRRRRGT